MRRETGSCCRADEKLSRAALNPQGSSRLSTSRVSPMCAPVLVSAAPCSPRALQSFCALEKTFAAPICAGRMDGCT